MKPNCQLLSSFMAMILIKMELEIHLQLFSANFPEDPNVTFKVIREHFQNLSRGMRSHMSSVVRVMKLILVCAATHATSECSFSATRRVKTYLQCTMSQQRLNNIMVIFTKIKLTSLIL